MIRIFLNVELQRTKNIEFFFDGIDDSINLRCETLYIADSEYVKISGFSVLDIIL